MDKLLSYEAWKQAQTEARAAGLRLSNCFFLPAELRKKIEAGVLFVQRAENALYLLEDGGSFWRCYYWFSPEKRPAPPEADREAVVEFPYAGELNQNQRAQIELLEGLGFRPARESAMMSCAPDGLIPHPLPETEQIRSALPEELPEILALLERSFDPRFAFLPTPEELRLAAEEDRVLAAIRDGRVAAALHAGFEKSVATVRQIAVDREYRGRGLGKSLLEAYHRRFAGQATAFQHWVDLHNRPALAMYESFGYGFSLRKANEYILAPKH